MRKRMRKKRRGEGGEGSSGGNEEKVIREKKERDKLNSNDERRSSIEGAHIRGKEGRFNYRENKGRRSVSSTSLPLQSPVKKRTLKRMKRRMRTGLICDGVRVTQRNSQTGKSSEHLISQTHYKKNSRK